NCEFQRCKVTRKPYPHVTHPARVESYAKWRVSEDSRCVLLLLLPLYGQTTDSKADPKQPTPTVFQADEGDHWILLGDKPLIFKVDPVSTGSDTLVVSTEEMPPGNRIPTHKHLYEDEVIFVHKGTVRVSLASRQYDARTGATVFIPHGNWDRSGK